MRLSKQIFDADDLAVRLARLSGQFIDAASERALFESIGEAFLFTAWAIEGPVLRERFNGWEDELRGSFQAPLTGDAVVPLDSKAVPPHFFASRRFRRVPETGLTEAVLRSLRDANGRMLSEEEIQAALAMDLKADGVYGPIFVGDAPWGLLALRWNEPSEEELDLFTLFASQVGAALQLLGTRTELIRANRELRAVHTLSRAEAPGVPPTAYQRILESAAAVTESETSTLFLLDPASGAVRLAGHHGLPCEWAKGNVLGRDEFFERVVRTMEPLVVERARPEQPWIALLPLEVERRTFGILLVARPPTERPFTFQEVARASLLASQLAVQLENARLLGETRRQNELLSSLYRLSRLLSQARGSEPPLQAALEFLIDADYSSACIYSLDEGRLERQVEAGVLRGPAQIALEDDHPLAAAARTNELQVTQCEGRPFAVVPLESSNRVVGCLAVARERGQALARHHLDILESFGAQIALAIEHSRLRRQEEDRVRQLRFLSEVGQIASSGRLDRHRLLSNFLEETASTLGFDAALGLFPHDPESGERWVSGEEPPAAVRGAMARLVAHVSQSRCDVRETRVDWGDDCPTHICAMPARSPTGVQAVFALARRCIPISLQEFGTLSAAGSNLGFALEDASRFERAQRSLDEMRLILDVGQAVTSTSDPDELLDTTAQAVNRLVGATRTVILLYDDASDELRCAALASRGGSPVALGQRLPNGREIISGPDVAVERRSEAPPPLREIYEAAGVQSSLTVHMKILDEPIGCIWIMDDAGPRTWSPSMVEQVKVIAHQVAIGIANLRLHDDLRASNRELARAQEELIKKERLAALGELAAVVAHEVRNPLGVIFNSMSSLGRLVRPEGDVKTLLEIVEEEASRLDRIVSDLLDFSRPNPIEPSWTDLGALVADVAATFPAEPGVEIRLEVEPDLPAVFVDERLLRQALLNLMQNGMQAMPKGGLLRLEVRRLRRDGEDRLAISVRDQGPGIPAELAAKIFEPFFTTKAKGSGLGLAVVQRIAEAHRGRLDLSSAPAEGSTFTIELDATERTE